MELAILLFLLPFFVFYFALLILFLGIERRDPEIPGEVPPISASVVIAARNEEKNMGPCLEALSKQNYSNFEVIVIDDRSSDKTAQIVSGFSFPGHSLRLLHVAENRSGISGKQNALENGIRAAAGEIILCTDADGRPDPSWITRMVSTLCLRKADFVFGRTRIRPGRPIWQKFQAAALDLLFGIALILHKLSMPGSCMGNNIGFLKEKYLEVGGHTAVGYHAAEDYALMARFRKSGFRITSVSEPLVETPAETSIRTYVRQQIRWLCGGLSGWFLLALLPIVLVHATIWLLPWFTLLAPAWGIIAILGLAVGFRSTEKSSWPFVIPLLAFFVAASPLLYVLALFKPRTVWKSDIVHTRPQS